MTTTELQWLTLRDITAITGYSIFTVRDKIAGWKARGLKAFKDKAGRHRVQAKDWEAVMTKLIKNERKI